MAPWPCPRRGFSVAAVDGDSCSAFCPLRPARPPSSYSCRSDTAALLSAPGLGVVALVLFVLFASLVAAVLFPL